MVAWVLSVFLLPRLLEEVFNLLEFIDVPFTFQGFKCLETLQHINY